MRDETSLHAAISHEILQTKEKMLYVPLDLENGLTIDALVDSGAYISAIAMNWTEANKKHPLISSKLTILRSFKIQVANGQLEKPFATTTLECAPGDHFFAKHFVVMKNLSGPTIGLHLLRHISVVNDTADGPVHFPRMTMQIKSAVNDTCVRRQAALIHDALTVPRMTTKTIKVVADHPSEWNTTGTVTPVGNFPKQRAC